MTPFSGDIYVIASFFGGVGERLQNKLESGHYHSASEVIRDALRLLEERDQMRELRMGELRKEIQRGIDSGDSTPLDIEAIKARGRQRLAERESGAS
jgi:antitoxin ParD1/3/4